MRYHGMVIRPPSEASSYILQVTYGCSHNRCTFCGTYLDKPFQARKTSEVLDDIRTAQKMMPGVRRVFLADGDALVLSTRRLAQILDTLRDGFSQFERAGIYASAQNLLAKSVDELAILCEKGLGIVYLGLESGSDEVLARVEKGVGSAEMIAATQKAKQAGLLVSVIGILGIGGMEFSEEHAQQTGRVVNAMDPDYFSMLTLMLVPGTPLYNQWQAGSFHLLKPSAMLTELHRVISQLDDLTQCVFRTNHASNYLPLRGTLSQDKERLLSVLDAALAQGATVLRPEAWRGL